MTYSATAPVKLLAGTAAAPGVTFTSDTDTGLFSPGANQVAVTTGGVQRLLVGADGSITPSGSLLFPAGTATAPSISFTGDTDTGLYSPGANQVAIATAGTGRLSVDTTAVTSTLPVLYPLGAAATPSISFTGDLNTGVYSPGADQVAISTAGTQKFAIDSFDGNPIIETSYPVIRPTLDLNFAATRRLDPRVTFSRASTATVTGSDGVIRSAAVNVPRFDHNPVTGESLGLLVEEARTNVIGYSEYFADSSWIKTGSVVVPNTFLSPSATFTASTLLATAANGTLTRSVTTTAVAMTFSVYLRRKTGAGNIDITANGSTWVTQTINSTEWTRCSIAQTAVAGTSNPGIRLVTSGDEVYVWGSQYE